MAATLLGWMVGIIEVLLIVALMRNWENCIGYCDSCGADILEGDEYYTDEIQTLCLSCHRVAAARAAVARAPELIPMPKEVVPCLRKQIVP